MRSPSCSACGETLTWENAVPAVNLARCSACGRAQSLTPTEINAASRLATFGLPLMVAVNDTGERLTIEWPRKPVPIWTILLAFVQAALIGAWACMTFARPDATSGLSLLSIVLISGVILQQWPGRRRLTIDFARVKTSLPPGHWPAIVIKSSQIREVSIRNITQHDDHNRVWRCFSVCVQVNVTMGWVPLIDALPHERDAEILRELIRDRLGLAKPVEPDANLVAVGA